MIVFDLQCTTGHVFEAWFGSSDAYETQQARGLLSCPLCGSAEVSKAVMAPAVAPKGNQTRSVPVESGAAPAPAVPAASQGPAAVLPPEKLEQLRDAIGKLAAAQARALEKSAWVGDRFAEKARAMHYGDEPVAPIHGVTEVDEARALIEEGIAVAPLLLPVVPPEECN